MTESWFVFYGHEMNMSRDETMNTRYGEMLDLINCKAIYNGGAEQKIRKRNLTFDEIISLR